jgi:hypothetical protein
MTKQSNRSPLGSDLLDGIISDAQCSIDELAPEIAKDPNSDAYRNRLYEEVLMRMAPVMGFGSAATTLADTISAEIATGPHGEIVEALHKFAASMSVGTSQSESALRKRASRCGYKILKSRRSDLDHQGGYMIVDAKTGGAVLGSRYDADLSDIAEYLALGRSQ